MQIGKNKRGERASWETGLAGLKRMNFDDSLQFRKSCTKPGCCQFVFDIRRKKHFAAPVHLKQKAQISAQNY